MPDVRLLTGFRRRCCVFNRRRTWIAFVVRLRVRFGQETCRFVDSVNDDRVKFVDAVIDEGVKFVEDQIVVLLEGKLCYDTSSTMRAHTDPCLWHRFLHLGIERHYSAL
jgi:hypothetical protein